MLNLPSGQVLVVNGPSVNQMWLYYPGRVASNLVAADRSEHRGPSHKRRVCADGTQLSGLTMGSSFGDDAQMDSNYPIITATRKGKRARSTIFV
jgi:hypothetical protein